MILSPKAVRLFLAALMAFSFAAFLCPLGYGSAADERTLSEAREAIKAKYGENKRISDGNYDKSLAVKCVNGTFVGRQAACWESALERPG